MSGVLQFAKEARTGALVCLLVLTPLARGSTPRWALAGAAWLALAGLSALVLRRIYDRRPPLPENPLQWPLLALLAVALTSALFSILPSASFWALIRLGLYIGVFYLTLETARDRHRIRWLVWLVMGVASFLCLLGLIKYLGGPVPVFWAYSVPDQAGFLTSTFLNHNHLAGYLEMVFCLGLGLLACGAAPVRPLWIGLLILIMMTFVLTMSRGAYISLSLALLLMGLLWARKWKVGRTKIMAVGLVLVVVVVAVFLSSDPAAERIQSLENLNEPSWMSRVMVWKGTLRLIGDHPWLGTGPGTFPWSFPAYRPPGLSLRFLETHNDYLQAVSEQGLWVMIPLIWGLVILFREGLVVYFRTTSRLFSGLALGGTCALAAILVHSGGDFNLQITSNGVLFSFVAGLVVAARRFHQESGLRREALKAENEIPFVLLDASGEKVFHDEEQEPEGSAG